MKPAWAQNFQQRNFKCASTYSLSTNDTYRKVPDSENYREEINTKYAVFQVEEKPLKQNQHNSRSCVHCSLNCTHSSSTLSHSPIQI